LPGVGVLVGVGVLSGVGVGREGVPSVDPGAGEAASWDGVAEPGVAAPGGGVPPLVECVVLPWVEERPEPPSPLVEPPRAPPLPGEDDGEEDEEEGEGEPPPVGAGPPPATGAPP